MTLKKQPFLIKNVFMNIIYCMGEKGIEQYKNISLNHFLVDFCLVYTSM